MRKVSILISGRSQEQLVAAQRLLSKNKKCRVELRHISNGHDDPLHGLKQMPDMLMMSDLDCEAELQTLGELDTSTRPVLIVFGEGDDPATMRLAMRAGARDY